MEVYAFEAKPQLCYNWIWAISDYVNNEVGGIDSCLHVALPALVLLSRYTFFLNQSYLHIHYNTYLF